MKTLFVCLLITLSFTAQATLAAQVGTITQTEGGVQLFTHPSKTLHQEGQTGTRVLFQGEYYLIRDVKVGDLIERGNIVRTAPEGKARVVFENGDQFNIGPGTSYRVTWDKDTQKAKTDIHLMYGKLRGVIEKGGPRSQLKIRTKSATMGVRGTDFYIEENPVDGSTEVSILRGAVEVKPQVASAKPIEVKSGQSASVVVAATDTTPKETTEEKAVPPLVELHTTTKEDLLGIQKASVILNKPTETAALPTEVAPEVKKKIETLETKAVETTLKDIQKHDPTLFAKLDTQKIKSTDELNTRTVKTLFDTAPKAPAARKPPMKELEEIDTGAYEKYFNID